MQDFDGITIIPPVKWDAPDTIIQTDSNLERGGGWSHGEAFITRFPNWIKQDRDIHINELELLTVIVAVKVWSKNTSNRNILAYCDNEVSVEVVNSGKARNLFAQECLRELCYINAKNNTVVKLVHLPGLQDRISDCLSRWGDENKCNQFWELTQGILVAFIEIADAFIEIADDYFWFCNTW